MKNVFKHDGGFPKMTLSHDHLLPLYESNKKVNNKDNY